MLFHTLPPRMIIMRESVCSFVSVRVRSKTERERVTSLLVALRFTRSDNSEHRPSTWLRARCPQTLSLSKGHCITANFFGAVTPMEWIIKSAMKEKKATKNSSVFFIDTSFFCFEIDRYETTRKVNLMYESF